jgi:transcriptional regulator with XRE-family HTH domain
MEYNKHEGGGGKMSLFGQRLKAARKFLGLTQKQVGEKLGKSTITVKKYEKGDRIPDVNALAEISKTFNISADYILGLTNMMHSPGDIPNENLPDYKEFIDCIKDSNFTKYLRLAVKMFKHKVEVDTVERIVDEVIEKSQT